MTIYLGADHRGFVLKEKLKFWLEEKGYQVVDMGAYEVSPEDDYVDFAKKVSSSIRKEKDSLGILICGSGAGVAITANKVRKVRTVLGINKEQVEAARSDDNVNVLALAADYLEEEQAKELVDAFLHTKFQSEERFLRRLRKIELLEEEEKNNLA